MRRRSSYTMSSATAGLFLEKQQRRLVAVWSINVLVNLKGWHQLLRDNRSVTSDHDILTAIGLGYLEGKNIDRRQFLNLLGEHKNKLSLERLAPNKNLDRNTRKLAEYLGLNDVERQILNFSLILKQDKGLQEVTDLLGDLNIDGTIGCLASILELPLDEVGKVIFNRKGLSAKISETHIAKTNCEKNDRGVLLASGLLALDNGSYYSLTNKLEVLEGFDDIVCMPNMSAEDMLSHYFTITGASVLNESNYPHISDHLAIIKSHMRHACENKTQGVNILIYGPPGTGKTEVAKVIAEEIHCNLHEVTIGDDEAPFNKKQRLGAFQLAQHVLKRQKNAILLFDEVDNLLEQHFGFFQNDKDSPSQKAWINNLLENNRVPSVWIANNIKVADSAFIRRFDIVCNLNIPSRSVRKEILSSSLADLNVSSQWIERLAENKNITPAVIAKVGHVLKTQLGHGTRDTENKVELLLESTLTAMGYPKRPVVSGISDTSYSLQAVNSNYDLSGVVKGVRHHGQGRICLYGPPGTGKTEFGHYLAKQIDRPLLVKRCSDLLTPYLGETEMKISEMFYEAVYENAVLLLDEADSFLQDRKRAQRSWEVTQVNELLTQMEQFSGVFICTTNLLDSLDAASLRRFDFKIYFDYLNPGQAWLLFSSFLTRNGSKVTKKKHWFDKLSKQPCLTPGDFATVTRKHRFSAQETTPENLFDGLVNETKFKNVDRPRRVGFLQ